ncbi:hypothetical protein SAMN04515691_0223 [Leifsonia sp. 98AMF]|uniref:hypothetical protein n=1 Tax=unclassified Leifsonia TaxID=2663824 RepID=UPI00087BD99B|nr:MULTISPECIES: hypothetical protein [unclassified Leifsonia]SDH71282.1 hypothetical protein SAMN04515690_3797 [Leifsonia sp. 197AMF]SDJ50858.1 hypothetical protein SAMN04515684_4006 [Leifsonia sp. 466MF]SDK23351.1 hypothetical protein SAMN04515683_2759 [Leifsonia sp. 157MF]SDN70783.1 hypothetical protein SAMN04515686_2193 [Leifsonia sp. 509MF]SEN37547.1 hypothetical protein SAMN04515685_2743 [Leifsonia sp. 467MF]
MTELVEPLPRAAADSPRRALRLALLGLAGAGLLTALGFLFQLTPASADEAPPPQHSLLGSVVNGTVGALLPGTSSPQSAGSGSGTSGGLVGSVLAPVTGAVDPLVTSLPVVGGVVDTLLGPTPTGSVVGIVDGVVNRVTGSGGGTTSPTPPPPPAGEPTPPPATTTPGGGTADPGTATGNADPAAAPAPAPAVATAPAATGSDADSAADQAAPSPAPTATPAPSPVTASAVATPADGPIHGPAFSPSSSAEGVLTSSGSGGSGSAAEPVDSWIPPFAPYDTSCAARTTEPSSAPPGDHDVSPG